MTNDPRTLAHQPPAITQPGELWHLNGFNLSAIIVVRDGPDAAGNHSFDGRHQITVAHFSTVRDAACAVQAHNAWEEVCGVLSELQSIKLKDRQAHLASAVFTIAHKYGRV